MCKKKEQLLVFGYDAKKGSKSQDMSEFYRMVLVESWMGKEKETK